MRDKVSELDVIKLLTARINNLKSELIRAESALHAMQSKDHLAAVRIESLSRKKKSLTTIRSHNKSSTVYDTNHIWDQKILFVLKEHEAFKEDIVNEISTHEPDVDKRKILNVVSVKLSQLLSQGVIEGRKVGRKYKYSIADQ